MPAVYADVQRSALIGRFFVYATRKMFGGTLARTRALGDGDLWNFESEWAIEVKAASHLDAPRTFLRQAHAFADGGWPLQHRVVCTWFYLNGLRRNERILRNVKTTHRLDTFLASRVRLLVVCDAATLLRFSERYGTYTVLRDGESADIVRMTYASMRKHAEDPARLRSELELSNDHVATTRLTTLRFRGREMTFTVFTLVAKPTHDALCPSEKP